MTKEDPKTTSKRMKDDTPGLVDEKVREQLQNEPGDRKEDNKK